MGGGGGGRELSNACMPISGAEAKTRATTRLDNDELQSRPAPFKAARANSEHYCGHGCRVHDCVSTKAVHSSVPVKLPHCINNAEDR